MPSTIGTPRRLAASDALSSSAAISASGRVIKTQFTAEHRDAFGWSEDLNGEQSKASISCPSGAPGALPPAIPREPR